MLDANGRLSAIEPPVFHRIETGMDWEQSSMERLIQQLELLCAGKATTREAEGVVRSCLSLVATYLRILERKGRHLRDTSREIEFELLASDCLAELFQKNEAGSYPRLNSYFQPLFQAGQTPQEIYNALMRLIIGHTRQQLTRIFRQRDPEGAKLWRTAIRAVKKQPHLKIIRDIGGYHLVLRTAEPPPAYYLPDAKNISSVLGSLLLDHTPLDQTLAALVEAISERSQQPVCIAMADIVTVLRIHRRSTENAVPFLLQENAPEWPAYAALIDHTLQRIGDVIIQKYIQTNKISPEEGLALFSALKAWSWSLFDENARKNSREHIESCWPEGLPMSRPARILSIFDYLVRIFRQEMKEKIANFF